MSEINDQFEIKTVQNPFASSVIINLFNMCILSFFSKFKGHPKRDLIFQS